MSGLWLELRLALGFLTDSGRHPGQRLLRSELGRSMAFFPLVGLLLGGLLVFTCLLAGLLPRPVRDALLLGLLVVLTGALHLDGIADLCDGVGGGNDREGMPAHHEGQLDRRLGSDRPGPAAAAQVPQPLTVSRQRQAGGAAADAGGRPLGTGATDRVHPLPARSGRDRSGVRRLRRRARVAAGTLTLLAVAAGAASTLPGLLLVGGMIPGGIGFGGGSRSRLGGVTGDVLGAASNCWKC